MKAGINKGIAVAGTSSMGALEKAKINSVIKTQEEEKRKLAELLGLKVYEMFVNSDDISSDDIESICVEMKKRDDFVGEQKRSLERIDSEINLVANSSKSYSAACKCGHVNASGSKFCAKCGSPLNW
jgi:NADH pyrophosphatase NudC (nudix superfamily)